MKLSFPPQQPRRAITKDLSGLGPAPAFTPPAFLITAAPVRFEQGFYHEEQSDDLPFRWMSRMGVVAFEPANAHRFLESWVNSNFYDLTQRVAAHCVSEAASEHPLVRGWNPLSIPVPPGARSVRLEVNTVFPPQHYPGDGRELAVQMRGVSLHGDPARHAHLVRQHENAVVNLRELLEGRTVLSSTPPKLGIDIQGACNVKPPCVYCAWDMNKALEGDNVDLPFTKETLDGWGAFFASSAELVNCSIGEPFMGRNIDELLSEFGDRGKLLEMTTNGQVFTEGNIRRLLGHNVHLYVSLDAATPGTYAKLRNTGFERVVENVRRLVKAKGGRGRLPLVYLVFMPMRANAHEVEPFVELAAATGVDRLVLRPLNPSEGVTLEWDRGGYHFDYQKELLPFEELVRISGRVAELCRRLSVPLADQLDFGGSIEGQFAEAFAAGRREVAARFETAATPWATPTAAPVTVLGGNPASAPAAPAAALPALGDGRLPACTEPWKSLYVLRRGVLPCCYGGRPVAPMGEFREAWNSPLLQGIRRELLAGRFHRYCLDSTDCPIVKKSDQAHALAPTQKALLESRRILERWKRGRPGEVYRTVRHRWLNAIGHVRRLASRRT